MATNFPGSLDSFTNPSSSSTLDSPSHAAQHANINDAMEAVQAKLGTGAGTIGTWTAFTPSWTNLTVGNGTQSAYYAQVNEVVTVIFYLTLGSTSSVSSGPRFDLPVTATGYPIYSGMGELMLYESGRGIDAGSPTYFGNKVLIRYLAVSGSNVRTFGIGSTFPFTWGTGDIIAGTFSYRAA